MIEALVYLAVVVLMIAANALFVAAEFALVAVEPHRMEDAAAGGDRRSRIVLRAIRALSFQLSGAQLGITVTSLIVGYIAEPAIATLLEPALDAAGLPDPPRGAVALALALVVATVSQMVFGELVPKNWAISEPVRVARAVGPLQVMFSRLCHPLIALLNGAANALLRAMGVQPRDELRAGRSPAELGSIVASSAAQGTLPTNTASLLRRSLRFGERRAADVMTPRVRTVFVAADAPLTELLRVSRETGLSRFPVHPAAAAGSPGSAGSTTGTGDTAPSAAPPPGAAPTAAGGTGENQDGGARTAGRSGGSPTTPAGGNTGPSGAGNSSAESGRDTEREDVDSVVGIVHVKDAFRIPAAERAHRQVREIMVAPVLVPTSLDCETLLTRLRRSGLQLAVVIDEYGGTAGIVTMEDLVEELVGPVSDEHDRPVTPNVVPLGARRWLLSGLLRVDEVADATGVRLPEGPYETIAGLILARLGRLARPDDRVEVYGHELVVVSLDRHRIDRVRLTAGTPGYPAAQPSAPSGEVQALGEAGRRRAGAPGEGGGDGGRDAEHDRRGGHDKSDGHGERGGQGRTGAGTAPS